MQSDSTQGLSRRRLLTIAGTGAAVIAAGAVAAACGSGGGGSTAATGSSSGSSAPAASSTGSGGGGAATGGAGALKAIDGGALGKMDASGNFTLNGDGADVWTNSDNCVYADQAWTKGDGDWSVQIGGMSDGSAPVNEWSKFGLMVRDSMDPAAAMFLVAATGNHGVIVNDRLNDGDQAEQQDSGNTTDSGTIDAGSLSYPVYLRVTRKGTTFQAYTSTDGKKWNSNGVSKDITMAKTYVGVFCLSHTGGSTITGKAAKPTGFVPTKIEQVGTA